MYDLLSRRKKAVENVQKSKDVPHKTYSFVVALVASIQVALVYSVLKHEDEDTKGKLFMLDLGVMETRVVKL